MHDDDSIQAPSTLHSHESGDVAAAREMAWNWFALHAQQRMTVFQSYLFIFGALFAGYGTLLSTGAKENAVFMIAVGVIAVLITHLFARLDRRNATLVKIGEDYLRIEQKRIRNSLCDSMYINNVEADFVNIVSRSDSIKNERKSEFYKHSCALYGIIGLIGVYSFSEIFRVVLFCFGLLSTFGIGYGIYILFAY